MIRIGFLQHTYEVQESATSESVMLIKENFVESEQTFSIEISVRPFPINLILPANSGIQQRDFAFSNGSASLNLQFLPTIDVLYVNLTIYNDIIVEGTEAFLLHASFQDRTPSYSIPTYSFPDTRIIIDDDDSKYVKMYLSTVLIATVFFLDITIGFEVDYFILEWENAVEVCLRYYNPPSFKTMAERDLRESRYEVQVDYESMNGSASKCKGSSPNFAHYTAAK